MGSEPSLAPAGVPMGTGAVSGGSSVSTGSHTLAQSLPSWLLNGCQPPQVACNLGLYG